MSIAIVGTGIVGSYMHNALNEKKLKAKVELIDISDESNVEGPYNIKETGGYQGLSKGRRFGKSGTSIAWGGQINFITNNDSLEGTQLAKIIQSYSSRVINRIFGKTINYSSQDIKKGYWLWPWKRNIAKTLLNGKSLDKTACVNRITILKNGLYRLESKYGKEIGVYSTVILTAGAFESARILANSGLVPRKLNFRDHISFKTHDVRDFRKSQYLTRIRPLLTSSGMITQRYIIQDGFIHFSFNEHIALFSIIKKYIFKIEQKIEFKLLDELSFIFTGLKDILRGFFPINSKVSVRVDIDSKNKSEANFVHFKKNGDTIVNWQIEKSDKQKVLKISEYLTKIFEKEKIQFKTANLRAENIANTYHPTGLLSDHMDRSLPYNLLSNPQIKVFSTGILPGAYSSNPTASILALVEKFLDEI